MSINNGEDSPNKEPLQLAHYDPQHPLPEEIRNLPRDQTVCRYCGVSYLIHNEIKALEDKLRAAERELEHLRGRQDRETALQAEVLKLRESIESTNANLKSKENV